MSPYWFVNRMILINSGRYGFAEVDLQTPVHLAAGNNQGKSTLVNALQFLYINDLGNMKFPNSDEETTRHYFEKALGDTYKPGAILPSLKPFSLERFLLLRQIVVNCFNSKEINSVHLIA